jgi:hypothetical protein
VADYKPLLASLKQNLVSKLGFRKTDLISGLHEVIGQATKNGHLNSGRIGIVVATAWARARRAGSRLSDQP